jgi:hypothetical protein
MLRFPKEWGKDDYVRLLREIEDSLRAHGGKRGIEIEFEDVPFEDVQCLW